MTFRYEVRQYMSPLDEKPWVYLFDDWYEVEEWIEEQEQSCEVFDINLCIITDLHKGP